MSEAKNEVGRTVGEAAAAWFSLLDGPMRSDRSKLRTVRVGWQNGAVAIDMIALCEIGAFWALHGALKPMKPQIETTAAIAIVLAGIKRDRDGDLGACFAEKSAGSAALNEDRFKVLMRSPRGPELVNEMAQAIAVIGGTAPVAAVAEAIFYWGDRVRERLSETYWSSAYGSYQLAADASAAAAHQAA